MEENIKLLLGQTSCTNDMLTIAFGQYQDIAHSPNSHQLTKAMAWEMMLLITAEANRRGHYLKKAS